MTLTEQERQADLDALKNFAEEFGYDYAQLADRFNDRNRWPIARGDL